LRQQLASRLTWFGRSLADFYKSIFDLHKKIDVRQAIAIVVSINDMQTSPSISYEADRKMLAVRMLLRIVLTALFDERVELSLIVFRHDGSDLATKRYDFVRTGKPDGLFIALPLGRGLLLALQALQESGLRRVTWRWRLSDESADRSIGWLCCHG
jgi:hypothetical protein